MIYVFTNRRRAKDSALAVTERHGTGGVGVVVREGLVYILVDSDFSELKGIMVLGEVCLMSQEEVMDYMMTELYRNNGIRRFRV